MQKRKLIKLAGSGNESRDFIHIQDVIRLLIRVINIKSFRSPMILNIGTGISTPIHKLAKHVQLCWSKEKTKLIKIKFSGTKRCFDPISLVANISKLKSYFALKPVLLKQGISNYGKWFLNAQTK